MKLVPGTRLLWWTALLVIPVATLLPLVPAAMPVLVGLLVLFALVVIVDAAGARKQLRGLSIELPAVVRLARDREDALTVRLRNESQRERAVRLAVALPAEFESELSELEVRLPAAVETSQVQWRCRSQVRGAFPIRKVHVETGSALGFWNWQESLPVESELRVYPNLAADRRSLAALFLNRGLVGLHAQRMVGKGRDFEKLRDYVHGDSIDEVHWKATAKRGSLVTKVFQVERTQEVYAVLDASRLSGRPVGGEAALERCINAALVLRLAAEQQGDHFGLVTFDDQVRSFIRARRGARHFDACRDALYQLQPQGVSPGFDEVFTFIRNRLRRRALLVFLTWLDDPVLAEQFATSIPRLARQHLVVVNTMRPQGVEPLFSADDVTEPGDVYERLSGHVQWQNLREVQGVLRQHGVQFHLLSHAHLAADLVGQYVAAKQRQAL